MLLVTERQGKVSTQNVTTAKCVSQLLNYKKTKCPVHLSIRKKVKFSLRGLELGKYCDHVVKK